MDNLQPNVLRAIDAHSAVDTVLLQFAVPLFLQRVVDAEARLGRRFLCDGVLHRVQPTMAYIIPNVTAVYAHATSL